jgi:hypothetical protein
MSARFTLVLVSIAVLSASALGQSLQGYGFFAPGQKRTPGESPFAMHFGGGAKLVWFDGCGIGFEAGMAGPKDNFSKMAAGVFSANVYYYRFPKDEGINRYHRNVEPFITGGYTRTFGNGNGLNWGNIGAGISFWSGKDFPEPGFMLEFRDHIGSEYGALVHFWTLRLGIAIRGKIYD